MPTDLGALRAFLFDERDMTPQVGAVKGFYVTRAADPGVRMNAQHGGTVTALISLALKEGWIDTAVLSRAERGLSAASVGVSDAREAEQLSKSRLVASPGVAAFNKIAKGDAKAIGVVATPCQALALAKMRMSRNPRIRQSTEKLRLVIGLFCGWAFSRSALMERLAEKVDPDSIVAMDIPPSAYQALHVFTAQGMLSVPLDEVQASVRESCSYCSDMTAEFSDISVGSARLPEGWEEARTWNHVIVRSEIGEKLMALARSQGVLEFREAPEGNLEKLKKAALGKTRTGQDNLTSLNKDGMLCT
jgi:coenzyme F420 hydrogenase subunit beta